MAHLLGGETLSGPIFEQLSAWQTSDKSTNTESIRRIAAVPEPASLVLLAIGGLPLVRRRR